MTLVLQQGTRPHGLKVKSFGRECNHEIWIGDYAVSLEDFVAMAEYVLVNTDLTENDPRRAFVQAVTQLREVPGFNQRSVRLQSEQMQPFLQPLYSESEGRS